MNLRPAQVRIYLDADLLGLGKILAGLRNDVTYPGDPELSSTSGSGRRARSRALTCSTRSGYRKSLLEAG